MTTNEDLAKLLDDLRDRMTRLEGTVHGLVVAVTGGPVPDPQEAAEIAAGQPKCPACGPMGSPVPNCPLCRGQGLGG